METRICKKCNIEKELSKANFPSGTYGKNNDKISYERMCKICKNKEGNLKYHGLFVKEEKPIELVRKCSGVCALEKELNKDNFYYDSGNKIFHKMCIACTAVENKKYRDENKEKIKVRKLELMAAKEKINIDELEPFYKICDGCNVEKIMTDFTFHIWHNNFINKCKVCNAEIARLYYEAHAQERRDYSKEYREKNIEKVTENNRLYKQEHKEELAEKAKIRVSSNPILKLRNGISSTINRYLRKGGGTKNNSSMMKYLQYTMDELMAHLESLFEPWMTRENRGIASRDKKTWHIDHIIPQDDLIYDSMDHINFQRCWAFANLRPLDAKENIAKFNNISDKLRAETWAKIDAELESRADNDFELE